MKNLLSIGLAFVLAAPIFPCAHAAQPPGTPLSAAAAPPLATIASLDVPRYMGTWFEVAKYPNRFQKQCVSDTRAEYALQADGRVKVTNRCRLISGATEEAVGAARQLGDANSAKLEVRFAPAWLSFLPAVWGNYWVIDLDANYQLVAVSEPKREFLWMLSRTPKPDPAAVGALMTRLGTLGFDLQRLEPSKHSE